MKRPDAAVVIDGVSAENVTVGDVRAPGPAVAIADSVVRGDIDIKGVESGTDASGPSTETSQAAGDVWRTPGVLLNRVVAGGKIIINYVVNVIAPPDRRAARLRAQMLDLVEHVWITSYLEPSLPFHPALTLDLTDASELVESQPFAPLIGLAPVNEASVAYLDLVARFHATGERLLIVGAPGSGKTTLLLQLGAALIAEARVDEDRPMPIVLHLGSWSARHPELGEWVLRELGTKYQVPRNVGQSWLVHDAIALLLDGLDEVAEADRDACVVAINAFRAQHAVPLVLCCREAEAARMRTRPHLATAVRVQPLSEPQVTAFLTGVGVGGALLARQVCAAPAVRDLAATPLMLGIIGKVAAGDTAMPGLPDRFGDDGWQARLLDAYVQRMMALRPGAAYTLEATRHWLRWLALLSGGQGEAIFLLETMQPALLPSRAWRLVYHAGTRTMAAGLCMVSIVAGLMAAAAVNPNPEATVAVGLNRGLIAGTSVAIGLVLASLVARHLPRPAGMVLAAGLTGLSLTLIAGNGSLQEVLLFGIVYGLPGSLVGVAVSGRQPIRPVALAWTRSKARLALGAALIAALATMVAMIALIGMTSGVLGALLVVCCCLIPAILFHLGRAIEIQPTITPNQGVHDTLVVASKVFGTVTMVGMLLGLITGLAQAGDHDSIGRQLAAGLIEGIALAVPLAFITTIAVTGAVGIQHFVLRGTLALAGSTPWRLQHFLDFATDRVLLRRIGGGYLFQHRLLHDYFANLEE